jgi:alcohol oxidase
MLSGYTFDTGFLNHPSDILKQRWAYKMSREIARRLPYYAGELELGHPKFKEGSAAALEAGALADAANVKDIVYSDEDDAAIEDWIRGNLSTTWHSLGTCKMAPREAGGVVDGKLDVYGTTGLKVVDLSMVPENVGGESSAATASPILSPFPGHVSCSRHVCYPPSARYTSQVRG